MSQQDHPLVLEREEGLDRIFTHVWSDSDRIEIHRLKKRLCIKRRCVTDIASLGVGDCEAVPGYVLDRLLQRQPSRRSQCFVEGNVWLVCYSKLGRCIDDL